MNFDTISTWPQLGFSDEITSGWENGPTAKNARILDRALEIVQGVPYPVTLRWLFYNLFQEGYFSGQKPSAKAKVKALAYGNFSKLLSRLKHSPIEFQEKWPFELADDRRDPLHFTAWHRTAQEWLDSEIKHASCLIDKMITQDRYVMIAFEAEAMQSQFIHYTQDYGVSLWPFSGMASIPYKKAMAKHITLIRKYFNLPVVLLYFGDLDPAGRQIPETSFRHVRKWAGVNFEAYRAGLNEEHVKKYHVQDDPDRPGKYQWEAVSDKAAAEIITGALDAILHLDAIREIVRQEETVTTKAREALAGVTL